MVFPHNQYALGCGQRGKSDAINPPKKKGESVLPGAGKSAWVFSRAGATRAAARAAAVTKNMGHTQSLNRL